MRCVPQTDGCGVELMRPNDIALAATLVLVSPAFMAYAVAQPNRHAGGGSAAPRISSPAPHIAAPHFAAPHLSAPHFAAPHVSAPHIAAPHFAAPHLSARHVDVRHFAAPFRHLAAPSHFASRP